MADVSVIIPTYNEKKNITRLIPRIASPLTDMKDPMNRYFFLKKSVIEDILFNPHGFKILLEILVKGKYNNVKEIPIAFKAREKEESKLGIGEYVSYLNLLLNKSRFNLITIYQPVTCHARSVR
ncbi:MAG TPA: hypothetical protein VIO58_15745 [Candidatus Methanoperedens sp.]